MRVVEGNEIKFVTEVQYIEKMGSDDAVVDAARVSMSKDSAEYSRERNEKLIGYLARENHWSPFAHSFMKFRFQAPIFIARQFQKHTVGFAWNEVSRRYVDEAPTFWVPDTWRKRPKAIKQGSTNEEEVNVCGKVLDRYIHKMHMAGMEYTDLLEDGVCPEQARAMMPQAMVTEWIWSGSIMAWARFVNLRKDSHAQQECWFYADRVAEHMLEHFPVSTKALIN